jgi:poly(3-hydroxyalkanoate) depolymerase
VGLCALAFNVRSRGEFVLAANKRVEEARIWGSGRERRQALLAESGAEIGKVWVHGRQLRYARIAGNGEPLLLCNGIGANLELALPLAAAMHSVPVVLFDLPGVGGSPPAGLLPSLSQYARLAVGVLDALGYRGGFTVAGVSWGGALAQRIARDYPQRVKHLVLMATTPGIVMMPARPGVLLRMATPQRYLSRSFMARNAPVIYGGEMRGRPDLAADFALLTRRLSAKTYLQQLAAIAGFSSLPWLRRIRCPALVMAGDDDPLIRTVNMRVLAALLPKARLHMVRGGGHLFMVLRAEETAAVIREFLAESALA